MRLRRWSALAVCLALGGVGRAVADDALPVGRWVVGAEGELRVVNLLADASYQLEFRDGKKIVSSSGTYAAKDGHLVLTQTKGDPIDFAYALEKGRLRLAAPGQSLEKGLSLAIDAGPIVGKWRSEKINSTWVLANDGALEAIQEGGSMKGAFEVVYAEPEETEGTLVIHNADKTDVVFRFALTEKATQLEIGGDPTAKDPAPQFVFRRLGDAGAAPADGGPKRPKFPAAPKLPGGGGGPAPTAPTAPAAPGGTPAPEAPAPAPAPAPAAESGPTWDTAGLTGKGFKVLKTNYDADGGVMSWVLEATKDITTYPQIKVIAYDADEIKVWDGYVSLSPSMVSKGERVRAQVGLPYSGTLKKIVKFVLVGA